MHVCDAGVDPIRVTLRIVWSPRLGASCSIHNVIKIEILGRLSLSGKSHAAEFFPGIKTTQEFKIMLLAWILRNAELDYNLYEFSEIVVPGIFASEEDAIRAFKGLQDRFADIPKRDGEGPGDDLPAAMLMTVQVGEAQQWLHRELQ